MELVHYSSMSLGRKVARMIELGEEFSEKDGRIRYVGMARGQLGVYLDRPRTESYFKCIGKKTYLMTKGEYTARI